MSDHDPSKGSDKKGITKWIQRIVSFLMVTLPLVAKDALVNYLSGNPSILYFIVGTVCVGGSTFIMVKTHRYVTFLKGGEISENLPPAKPPEPIPEPAKVPEPNSGALLPANEPTPTINPELFKGISPKQLVAHEGDVVLCLGDFLVTTFRSSFVVLRVYGKDVLTISKKADGIEVSADVWADDGRLIATIEKNAYRTNPNNTLPLLRPDPHTLIVENERKVRVLYVRFLNPTTIKVTGIFKAAGGHYPVVVTDEQIMFRPISVGNGIGTNAQLGAMFDLPGHVIASVKLNPPDIIPFGQIVIVEIHNKNPRGELDMIGLLARCKNGVELPIFMFRNDGSGQETGILYGNASFHIRPDSEWDYDPTK